MIILLREVAMAIAVDMPICMGDISHLDEELKQ